MKTWKLLLLALVPGLWGWLCNWLTAVSLNGPAFLFTLAFYIQVPAAIVFCLWLGHLCGRSERSYPACLLLTQWPSLVSFALYVWQFHFVSSEARSFLLAGLGQYPGLPLFSLACRLVIPFSNHSWGPPETLAANALSLLMLAVLATGIWQLYVLLRRTDYARPVKAAFLLVYCAILLEFAVEPIIEGMPWLFSCYCLINGCLAGMTDAAARGGGAVRNEDIAD